MVKLNSDSIIVFKSDSTDRFDNRFSDRYDMKMSHKHYPNISITASNCLLFAILGLHLKI